MFLAIMFLQFLTISAISYNYVSSTPGMAGWLIQCAHLNKWKIFKVNRTAHATSKLNANYVRSFYFSRAEVLNSAFHLQNHLKMTSDCLRFSNYICKDVTSGYNEKMHRIQTNKKAKDKYLHKKNKRNKYLNKSTSISISTDKECKNLN